MRVTIKFKEQSDTRLVESVGGVVENELKNIPQLLLADLTNEMIVNLMTHESIEHIIPIKMEAESELHGYTSDSNMFTHHLNVLRAKDYWDRGITGKGVKVGIIDYNVGYHHALTIAEGNQMGDSKNWTVTPSTNAATVTHGTWCAGLVAGKPVLSNVEFPTYGVLGGMAPDAEIYPVKYGLVGYSTAAAFDWFIEMGVDIVSISLAMTSTLTNDGPIYEAAEKAGIIVVCSAGNTNAEIPSSQFPAMSGKAVVVSGLNEKLKRHTYNYGDTVLFSAPCINVTSLKHDSKIENFINTGFHKGNGTSGSAPLVAGVFALYRQAFPDKSKQELIDIIAKDSRKINGVYWDKYVGFGLPQPSKEIMSLPIISNHGGLKFSGNSDYVNAGKSESLNLKDNLTLISRFKQKSRNSGHLFAKTDGTKIYYGIKLGFDGIYLEWVEGTTQKSAKLFRSFSDEQEHEIAVVYNYPTVTLYIDGEKLDHDMSVFNMTAQMAPSTHDLFIGGYANDSFAGIIYDVKVYNRSLTDDEVLNDYNGTVSTDGIKLYYEFTGEEETLVTDLTGNGNHGTVYGARSNVKYIDESFLNGVGTRVPPLEVSNLAWTSTDHSVTLTWVKSLTPNVKYDIFVPGNPKPILSTSSLTATFNNLPSATELEYRVVSVVNGDSSPGVVVKPLTKVDVTPPSPVTALVATAGATDVLLSWTKSASFEVVKHEIWFAPSGTPIESASLASSEVTGTFYALEGLTPSVSYDIWVIATDPLKATPVKTTISTLATPAVLVQDTFTRADDALTLGTPEIGGTAYKYSAGAGTSKYGIASNKAVGKATPFYVNPAYVPVTSANYAVEITISEMGAIEAIFPRFSGLYSDSIMVSTYLGKWRFNKWVGGTMEAWKQPSSPELVPGIVETGITAQNGDIWRMECYSDGTMKFILNGVKVFEAKDDKHMAYIQNVGFGAGYGAAGDVGTSKFDDFKIVQI